MVTSASTMQESFTEKPLPAWLKRSSLMKFEGPQIQFLALNQYNLQQVEKKNKQTNKRFSVNIAAA